MHVFANGQSRCGDAGKVPGLDWDCQDGDGHSTTSAIAVCCTPANAIYVPSRSGRAKKQSARGFNNQSAPDRRLARVKTIPTTGERRQQVL